MLNILLYVPYLKLLRVSFLGIGLDFGERILSCKMDKLACSPLARRAACCGRMSSDLCLGMVGLMCSDIDSSESVSFLGFSVV